MQQLFPTLTFSLVYFLSLKVKLNSVHVSSDDGSVPNDWFSSNLDFTNDGSVGGNEGIKQKGGL